MTSKVGEEGFLVGEDGCVGFFWCPTQLDAEEASVLVVVYVARREMGFGNEAEPKTDAAVAIVCFFWWSLGATNTKKKREENSGGDSLPDLLTSASTDLHSSSNMHDLFVHLATLLAAPIPCREQVSFRFTRLFVLRKGTYPFPDLLDPHTTADDVLCPITEPFQLIERAIHRDGTVRFPQRDRRRPAT